MLMDLKKALVFLTAYCCVLFRISLSSKVPALFLFGDSLIDPGNELGLNFSPPPYMAPNKSASAILQGVNYASAGSGILNQTGFMWIGRIDMDAQIGNFEKTRQDIISMKGASAAQDLFKKAIFIVALGSNDFLCNYIAPIFDAAKRVLVSPQVFVASMTSTFRKQLTQLYNLGGRKFIVVNVGPIGCIPFQRDINYPSAGEECASLANELAQSFNVQLKSLVKELNKNLEGSNYVHADVYHIVQDILHNYRAYGFENSNSSCCHMAGRFGGLAPCLPGSTVCKDRSKYVFWDAFHPSDAANTIIASRVLDGDTKDIWPINLRKLSQL
ncbi:hypothetical protein K1719_005990 [Acacia pycnantha]|nr:hypothetical protein K1719_005990 [Acacia pycnantha]